MTVSPCLECGGPKEIKRRGEFCSTKCRNDWNNRRMQRGAAIYDLFMSCRFDRATAADLSLWKFLNRLASDARAEDDAKRDGRRSYRKPKDVLADRPALKADILCYSHRVGR